MCFIFECFYGMNIIGLGCTKMVFLQSKGRKNKHTSKTYRNKIITLLVGVWIMGLVLDLVIVPEYK